MKKALLILSFITFKVNAQNMSLTQNFRGDTVYVERAKLYCYADPKQIFEPYQYYKTVDDIYFRVECDGYIMYVEETQELYTCRSLSYKNIPYHLVYILDKVRRKIQWF